MIVFTLPNGVCCHLVGDHAKRSKHAALHSMVHLILSGQLIGVLLSASAEYDKEDSTIHRDITEILKDYLDPFVEPTGLPPLCSHDHRIPPVPKASPTNI